MLMHLPLMAKWIDIKFNGRNLTEIGWNLTEKSYWKKNMWVRPICKDIRYFIQMRWQPISVLNSSLKENLALHWQELGVLSVNRPYIFFNITASWNEVQRANHQHESKGLVFSVWSSQFLTTGLCRIWDFLFISNSISILAYRDTYRIMGVYHNTYRIMAYQYRYTPNIHHLIFDFFGPNHVIEHIIWHGAA